MCVCVCVVWYDEGAVIHKPLAVSSLQSASCRLHNYIHAHSMAHVQNVFVCAQPSHRINMCP